MCAFMPKYHWFPFFDDVISGSRRCSLFFVEGDAAINVASTMVPPRSSSPFAGEMLGNGRENRLRQVVTLEQMTEIEDCRFVRDGVAAEFETCGEHAHRLNVIECFFGARGQTGCTIAASNRCAAWSIVGTAAARLAARPSDMGGLINASSAPHGTTAAISVSYMSRFVRFLLCRKVERRKAQLVHRRPLELMTPVCHDPRVVQRFPSLRSGSRSPVTQLAFEWLILTAVGVAEKRVWPDGTRSTRSWRSALIPTDRMKAKRPHIVPLAPRCLEILIQIRDVLSRGDLVFPGTTAGEPLSDMTLTKVLRDMGLADHATVHGMRSAFKIWCAEVAKVRDEVSEAALAHTIVEKVRAAYLRTDFLEDRKALMAAWAEYCVSLPKSAACHKSETARI